MLELTGKPESLKKIVPDRPGHDRRYLLDSSKLRRELGWQPQVSFEDGLRATVDWYRSHERWWRRIKSGEFRTYYQQMYGKRLLEGTGG